MTARNTATRDRHRAQIKRGKPPCALCGLPIDYTLPYLDPGAYVVDHIVPLAKGGNDEIDNKQPAHRSCNRDKSDKTAEEIAAEASVRTFVTSRIW
jgi:5-methylcytosine-specific restriction endonuclease McrA